MTGQEVLRETPGVKNTPLNVLDPVAEMGVTGIDVGPRVQDRNDWLSGPILLPITQLHNSRAMPEPAKVICVKPPRTAQYLCHWLAVTPPST
jgi:hypothetical protein